MTKHTMVGKLKLCAELIKELYVRVLKHEEFLNMLDYIKGTIHMMLRQGRDIGICLLNMETLEDILEMILKIENKQQFMEVEGDLLSMISICGLDYYITDEDLKMAHIF